MWRTPFAEQYTGSFQHAKLTDERFIIIKKVSVKVDSVILAGLPRGRVNKHRLDATNEKGIALHRAKDDAEALQDAAKFAQRVRRRLGLSQLEFSRRIDVSLETIRNWEQGKRRPTGAAKALLKVLDKAPEAALSALA